MHIWPECFSTADKAYLENTWVGFPSIAEVLALKLCELYEEALSTGTILPISLRNSATQGLSSGIGGYPIDDYEKIIRRVKKTLEKLIDSIETNVGIGAVDLVEARLECGYLQNIERYAMFLVEVGQVEQAFSIAELVEGRGKFGDIVVDAIVSKASDIDERMPSSQALRKALNKLEVKNYEWVKPKLNFWNENINPISVLNHVGALARGEYGDTVQAVNLVISMVSSLTMSQTRIPILEILSYIDDESKSKIVSDVYNSKSSNEEYAKLISMIDPIALFRRHGDVDVITSSIKVFRMFENSELPEWYTSALSISALNLYKKSMSICHYWYALTCSKVEIQDIGIPQSFYDAYKAFLIVLNGEDCVRMNDGEYIKWDYAQSKVMFSGDAVGDTLLDIFAKVLPGVASEINNAPNNRSLLSLIRDKDAALFLFTSGIILRRCGLVEELVSVIAKTLCDNFQVARLISECLGLTSKEMARHPLFRESLLSADLGL